MSRIIFSYSRILNATVFITLQRVTFTKISEPEFTCHNLRILRRKNLKNSFGNTLKFQITLKCLCFLNVSVERLETRRPQRKIQGTM